MILVDTKWNSGLYDFDGKTLSKVLKLYKNDGVVYFGRFEYSYNDDYREATDEEIDMYKNNYYDDNGSLVFG